MKRFEHHATFPETEPGPQFKRFYSLLSFWNSPLLLNSEYDTLYVLQGGPERSRQSNSAVFAVEGGLDSKFPHVK